MRGGQSRDATVARYALTVLTYGPSRRPVYTVRTVVTVVQYALAVSTVRHDRRTVETVVKK